jgi:phosphatidylserine/phosphatidylglycerophosphate/cardiolipin synthase-like enzyme
MTNPALANEVQACFTPQVAGACDPQGAVLTAIKDARTTIRIQMYSLTVEEVVAELVNAKRRGIDVRAIVDRDQLQHDRNDSRRIAALVAAGVPVLVDTVPGLMHNKVMVVDDDTVLTGSFNYTWGAEHLNAENLIVLHDPALAAEYMRYWNQRAAQSQPLSGSGRGSVGPVIGNRRTMIYQWPACPYYGRVSLRNRVDFVDARAAEAAGFRPARGCR